MALTQPAAWPGSDRSEPRPWRDRTASPAGLDIWRRSRCMKRATSSRGSRATSRSTPALSPPLLNSATQYLPCSTASLSTSAWKQIKRLRRVAVDPGQMRGPRERRGRSARLASGYSAIPHCRSCSCSRPGTKKSASNKRPGLQGSFEAAGSWAPKNTTSDDLPGSEFDN